MGLRNFGFYSSAGLGILTRIEAKILLIAFTFVCCGCSLHKKYHNPVVHTSIRSEWISAYRDAEPSAVLTPKFVLNKLFDSTDDHITVYPSEFYWYFQLTVGGQLIKGTLVWGLEDPDKVELSYYVNRRRFLNDGSFEFFSGKDDGSSADLVVDLGCEVGPIERNQVELYRRIRCLGKDKVFHYPFVNVEPEKNRAFLKQSGAILNGEQHWADFIDESGLKFSAIFLPDERMFIEILHPDDERLVRLTYYPEQNVYHDANTDFVFYKEGKRYILIGLFKSHVLENSMNDGPHDQLPHADMWAGNIEPIGKFIPMLGRYLPQFATDSYGNLKNYPFARFIITEHYRYSHINEFSYVPKCLRSSSFHHCLQNSNNDVMQPPGRSKASSAR